PRVAFGARPHRPAPQGGRGPRLGGDDGAERPGARGLPRRGAPVAMAAAHGGATNRHRGAGVCPRRRDAAGGRGPGRSAGGDSAVIDLVPGGVERADRATAVHRFLAQFPEAARAQAVHLALCALRARVEPDRVLACELAWEVHTRGYWSHLAGADGRPYESEEAYFRDVLGLASWRTAYKRLAIGRMLHAFPEPERGAMRAAVAQVGLAKAAIVVPAIERAGEWQTWVAWPSNWP